MTDALHLDTLLANTNLAFSADMPKRWRQSLSLFALISCVCASSQPFENTAIVRSTELGGSLVHVTTTYAVRALKNGVKTYTIALGEEEDQHTSWFEVKVKGENKALVAEHRHTPPTQSVTFLERVAYPHYIQTLPPYRRDLAQGIVS